MNEIKDLKSPFAIVRSNGLFFCVLYKIVSNSKNTYILTTFEECAGRRSNYTGIVFIANNVVGEIICRHVTGDEKARLIKKRVNASENITICKNTFPDLVEYGVVKEDRFCFEDEELIKRYIKNGVV